MQSWAMYLCISHSRDKGINYLCMSFSPIYTITLNQFKVVSLSVNHKMDVVWP